MVQVYKYHRAELSLIPTPLSTHIHISVPSYAITSGQSVLLTEIPAIKPQGDVDV